jgi:DNA helicase HerA-like ATPase
MIHFLEQLVSSLWNRLQGRQRRGGKECTGMTTLGFRVAEEQVTKRRVGLSQTRRTMHQALLGKTGTGKSSLLKYLCLQDIEAGRGFVYFDLHGDATPFLLRAIAAQEWKPSALSESDPLVPGRSDPG